MYGDVIYSMVTMTTLPDPPPPPPPRLDMVCTINQEVVCQERISGEKLSPMCHMALNLVAMEIVVTREQLIWTYNIVNERRSVHTALGRGQYTQHWVEVSTHSTHSTTDPNN